MTQTETFRKNTLRRLYRQPLPLWISRIKGKGFYVIKKGHVIKGVVGDVIISSRHMKKSEFERYYGDLPYRMCRKELVVQLTLYATPYDIVVDDYCADWPYSELLVNEIVSDKGLIDVYGIEDLFKSKHDALQYLKETQK